MSERVSVIVANACSHAAEVAAAVDSLERELWAGVDEVIWVDRAGLGPQMSEAKYLAVPARCGRGEMYAAGLESATGEIAAFTDSTTVVLPGWRGAVVEAFAAGAALAGGPVTLVGQGGIRYLAGFLSEYAFHAVAPYTSVTGDVSGNNVAYRRGALEGVRGALWKSEVDRELMSRGITPVVAPGMRVAAAKAYPWVWFIAERMRQGRLYSLMRTVGWVPGKRVAYALATVVLPAVLFARTAGRVFPDPELRRALLLSAPILLVAMISWSVGEALGAVGIRGGDVGPF